MVEMHRRRWFLNMIPGPWSLFYQLLTVERDLDLQMHLCEQQGDHMRKDTAVKTGLLAVMLSGSLALAQEAPQYGQPQGQWRRMGPPGAQQGFPQGSRQGQVPPPVARPLPPELTIAPGTFLTIRVNQVISSDHNQQGDAFSAVLVKPVVVDGVVVVDRGQVIQGRVSDAQKAGRAKGTSRLGLELTDMTLVDGHQVPVRTQLVSRNGSTSVGRDATAIGTTTAVGAAIGAAAGLGEGAAIGAGAGAAAGIIGVLLTRGNPTVVYPEQVLTFRLENPVAISTERAPQAFRDVTPDDYQQPSDEPRFRPRPVAPPPYWGPYGYPYYWGPSLGIGFGYGGFYGGRRGFYGGHRGRW
jgi:hypothetical protein